MGDTARLLLQVDAAVAIAQSNLRSLAATMDTESANYDRSVKKIEGAHLRMNGAMNQSRMSMMEMEHVFRSMGDSVAAGQDPIRAFTMEIGRVAEAATMMGGSMGGVGKLLAGPWGLALTAGVGLLASLGIGHKDAAEESKKQETIENLLIRTLKGEEEATRKLTEAIREKTKAAQAAIETDRERVKTAFLEAQGNVSTAMGARPRLQGERDEAARALADRQREANVALAALKKDPASDDAAHAAERAAISLQAAQTTSERAAKAWKDNETRIVELRNLAATQQLALLNIVSNRATDEGEAIKGRAEHATEALRAARKRELDAAGEDQAKQRAANQRYVESLNAVIRQRKKEEEALAESLKKHRDTTARDEASATNLAYMQQFLRDALPGVHISPNERHSKYVAGTNRISDHYYDRAIDFVPPGGVASMTKDQVRELFEGAGIRIRRNAAGVEQLFGPGDKGHSDHFHVAWEGSAPRPGTVARRERTSEIHAANDDRAYQTELGQAQSRYSAALLALADTAEGRYAIEIAGLEYAQHQRVLEIDDQVKAGKINQAQADKLKATIDETELLQEIKAKQVERQAILDRQLQRNRAELGDEISILHLQEGLAITTKERLRIALKILADEEDEARLVAQRKLKSNNQEIRAEGQRDLNRIDAEHPFKVAQINQRNADPLTSYMQQLKANTGDMNEALKGVEVDGLKSLEDGILGVINGTESLASAFKKMASSILADLARIAIEKSILSMLSALSGGGGGGYGGPADSIGSFNPGSGPGFSGMGFAAGGSPPPGMASLVGEKGPELFIPKTPGVIIPNHMLGGGKGGGSDVIVVHIDKSELFDAHVEQVSGRTLAVAAPHIVAAAQRSTISSLSRRGING